MSGKAEIPVAQPMQPRRVIGKRLEKSKRQIAPTSRGGSDIDILNGQI